MSSNDIPTATYPTGRPAAPSTPRGRRLALAAQAAPADDLSILDAGRPRRLPAAHPSAVQLFVGAVIAIIAFTWLAHSATRGMSDAAAHCHHLMATDWSQAERECGARYLGTEPAQEAPRPAVAGDAPAEPPSEAPAVAPAVWVTADTDAPYDRTDPAASPLDLARCTTSTGYDELPCLASVSAGGARVVVLEEDASLTAVVRR